MAHSNEPSLAERLLNSYQRDFPLVREPFAHMAEVLGVREDGVLSVCEALINSGAVARIGGVVRPNTIAASTLAAISVPDLSADGIADAICALEGVNHVYLRENPINIWFVATGPDRNFVGRTLRDVEHIARRPVLDLRLERAFHIDLGFPLDAGAVRRQAAEPRDDVAYHAEAGDRELLQALTTGLPLIPRPFRTAGETAGISEDDVIGRLRHFLRAGVVARIGAIVRHRALGWRSNAMVVWDVPGEEIGAKAGLLARQPGVNLCYQRTRYEGIWPYNLYCMIHAKTRQMAHETLESAARCAGLETYPRQILFSSRCYKQTGALILAPRKAA